MESKNDNQIENEINTNKIENINSECNPYQSDVMGEEEELSSKEYLGTFRWKKSLKFPLLKEYVLDINFNFTNWGHYLETRTDFQIEPYIVDALSYPMSVIACLEELRKAQSTKNLFEKITKEKKINLVVTGASSKAELRIALESNYFDEIYYYLLNVMKINNFHLTLHFVGEEIGIKSSYQSKRNQNLVYSFFQGTTGDFLKLNAFECSKMNTIVVGMNCGFGAGYIKLSLSWVKDLIKLFKLGYLMAFTYTNTWEDMPGEYAIIEQVLEWLIEVKCQENSFKSMTIYKNTEELWSCGNYGFYVPALNSNKERLAILSKMDESQLKKLISDSLTNAGVKVK